MTFDPQNDLALLKGNFRPSTVFPLSTDSPELLQDVYVAGYPFGRWEVSAYVNNLADQRYDAVGYQNGFVTVYSPPREAGLRLSWQL